MKVIHQLWSDAWYYALRRVADVYVVLLHFFNKVNYISLIHYTSSNLREVTIDQPLLGVLAKLRKGASSFVMSVRLSARNDSVPTGRIFMEFDIWVLFDNVSIENQVSLKYDKNKGYFTFKTNIYRTFHNVLRDYKHLKQENQKTYLNGIFHSHKKTEKVFFFFLTTRDIRCVHHGWHSTHRYDIQVVATHTLTRVWQQLSCVC